MHVLLAVTLAAQLVFLAFLAVGIVSPRKRVWPPPSGRSWQLYATWIASYVVLSGAFLLAVLEGNTLGLPLTVRLGLGLPLLAIGVFLLGWGVHVLRVQATLGLRGQLVRSGPYRWSRNPQYVGTCFYLAALALLGGGQLTAIACLAASTSFVLAPFAEEPWLAEQFGLAYEEYRRSTPRFVGVRGMEPRP